MKEIKVGCCGFPRTRSEYYQSFKVVKVQQTFYQPPTLKTVERWRAEEVRGLCQDLNIIHGVDPFKAESQFGEVQYIRLHGITGYGYRFNLLS